MHWLLASGSLFLSSTTPVAIFSLALANIPSSRARNDLVPRTVIFAHRMLKPLTSQALWAEGSRIVSSRRYRVLEKTCTGLYRNFSGTSARFSSSPLSSINPSLADAVESLQIPAEIEKKFMSKVNDSVSRYSQKPQKFKPVSALRLVDYVNPKWENLAQLALSIDQNSYPQDLESHYHLQHKSQLLQQILHKLINKLSYEEDILKATPLSEQIDFSNPAQWYPETRKMKRKIIMHVGPTNSGKTYRLLQKLQHCKSGYYAGPLRLLAREIYENFNSRGIPCNLVTGEEVIPSLDSSGKISNITSGTIEMVPLFKKMDLCIIDEIQMIADEMRGEAWTNALLGVQAKEVHLCGEERAVSLVKNIVKLTGDELEVHKHERLGKLEVATKPVGDMKNLKPGDCVVLFLKRKILQLKVAIERKTKYKVAVIYGALPPEIRSEQAQGFNKGKYDILVASDAVGMGLNLAIRRIVFSSTEKFNGFTTQKLTKSIVRQIGGRAGRFSHDMDKVGGIVSAFTMRDLKYIQRNMFAAIEDIEKARIWPTNEVWTTYLSKYPASRPSISIVPAFGQTDIESPTFSLTAIDGRMDVLQLMMKGNLYTKLTIEDQLRLSIAPINFRNSEQVQNAAFELIRNIAEPQSKSILDFKFLPLDILAQDIPKVLPFAQAMDKLSALEDAHKLVLLFMWLGQRWPYLFVDIESAHDWKLLIEKRISEELGSLKQSKKRK